MTSLHPFRLQRLRLASIAIVATGILLISQHETSAQDRWISESGDTLLVEHVAAQEFNEIAALYAAIFAKHDAVLANKPNHQAAPEPPPPPPPPPPTLIWFRVYDDIPFGLTTADGVSVVCFENLKEAFAFSRSLDDRTLMSGLIHAGGLRTLEPEILYDPVWFETIMTCLLATASQSR